MNYLKRFIPFFWILFAFAFPGYAETSSPKIVGYYHFGSARDGFLPSQIRAEFLTHVIYAFIDVSEDGVCQIIPDKGRLEQNRKIVEQFRDLKRKNPQLKTMFSIGGASHSKFISDAVITPEKRQKLIRSCINLMQKYAFDGVDIDWEFPVRGTRKTTHKCPEDRENLVAFLAELRQALPPRAPLSAAVSAEPKDYSNLDVKGMSRYLDWFGIMVYDFCMGDSDTACHHSLYLDSSQAPNGREAIQWYLRQGATTNQIVLGVPFFGYLWNVESLKNHGIGQNTVGSSTRGPYDGSFSFREIKEQFMNRPGFQLFWDQQAKEPLLINPHTRQVLSFDNECSIGEKAKLVRKEKRGGIMIWELAADDAQHNLLQSIHRGFLNRESHQTCE